MHPKLKGKTKMKSHLVRKIVVTTISLVLLILLTACAGVGTNANGSVTSITGTITGVSTSNNSVTLSVGGTSYTVNGLSTQEVQALQSQTGKTYTVQVTQNSDGSYSITVGTNPTPAANETPGVNETPEPSETPGSTETPNSTETANSTGSFTLVGPVQSASSSSLTVTMPDGTALNIAINAQTDQSDLNGAQLNAGQKVKVDVTGTSSGLSADKIKLADSGDQADANTIEFKGATTQAVGSDHMLHFNVGNHSFSYAIGSSANLGDFNGNASSIASGTPVKVKVQFNGTTGTIIKVSNNS
jgi:hypothetical protein